MLPDDVPEVVEIEKESFTTPWSAISFYNEIYNPRSLSRVAVIIEDEFRGTIAGYICMNRILDECHILNLAVKPEHRRKGIAKALLKNVLDSDEIKPCRFVYLEVRVSNYPARSLYKSFGFREIGLRKGYYHNPVEDAVVMLLEREG